MSSTNAEQEVSVEAEASQDSRIYLYHVLASMNGDSLDLYVRAHAPEQATRFMYKYYDLPITKNSTDAPPRIFRLPETSGPLGPIAWGDVEKWTAKASRGRISLSRP